MRGRFVTALGVLAAVLLGWGWLQARSMDSAARPASRVLQRGVYYGIDLSSAATTILLPGDPAGPFDLIISSLGDSDRKFHVMLSSGRGSESTIHRPHEIAELRRSQWHRVADFESCAGGAVIVPEEAESPSVATERDRTFFVHVADTPFEDPRGYARISATLAGEGRDVRVFRDSQLTAADIAHGLVEAIIEHLDERVIPHSRSFLGVHRDVDGDGKLAILLTPWLGRLQGGRTSVRGFVRTADFRPGAMEPFGSRTDVIYLNSNLQAGAPLAALLAHEYTHAVCFGLRLRDGELAESLPDEADWLNEALAHVAEQMHGAGWSNLDRRVRSYLEDPEQAPLVVRDYYHAGLWRNDACRGATYLFLQWCTDMFGPGLLRELASHPSTGVSKLEEVTGHSFEALYRHWTIAVHQGRIGSLELRGPLGDCRLDGPRLRPWQPDAGPYELELRGTTSAFVRLEETSAMTTRSITITGSPGVGLQVTIVRPD